MDFSTGKVYQYTGNFADEELIETFMYDEGFQLSNIEWMTHDEGGVVVLTQNEDCHGE